MMDKNRTTAPLSRRSLVLSAAGAALAAACAPLVGALAGEAGAEVGAATTVAAAAEAGAESEAADTGAQLLSETPGARVTRSTNSYLIVTQHYSVEFPDSLFPEGFVWTYSDGTGVDYFGGGDGPFSGYSLDIYGDDGAKLLFGVYCATEGLEGTGFMADLGPSPVDASWQVRTYAPSSQEALETYAGLVALVAGANTGANGDEKAKAAASEKAAGAGRTLAPLSAGDVVATPYYEVRAPENAFQGDWGWRFADEAAEFLSPETAPSSDKNDVDVSGSAPARCGFTLLLSPEDGSSLYVTCCSEGWLSTLGVGPAVEAGAFEHEGETWHVFAHATQSIWPTDRIAEAYTELTVPETGPSLDELAKMVAVTYADGANNGAAQSNTTAHS